MLRLKETAVLTVYNGSEKEERGENVEDHVIPLSVILEQWKNAGGGDEGLTEEMKQCHRKLLFGEPLGKELLAKLVHSVAYGLDSWSSIGLGKALESALHIVRKLGDDGEYFEKNRLQYDDTYLYTGVMLLRIFIQLNFTGPDFYAEDVKKQIELIDGECRQGVVEASVKKLLELDAIEVEPNVKAPALLLVAKHFISSMEKRPATWPFFVIWRFRIDFLNQRILTRRCWTLSRRLKYFADTYLQWMKDACGKDDVMNEINAGFLCEVSEMLVYYFDGILSDRFLEEAMKLLNLKVELTGKMGFRTRYQQSPMSQTVLHIEVGADSTVSVEDEMALFPFLAQQLPRSEPLNDDTRLERVRLVDNETFPPHSGLHQLVIVGMMLHKKGFQGNTDLSRQEIQALVHAILDNPISWNGRLSALATRCFIERVDRRAVDRSLRQLEELVKLVAHQFRQTEAPPRQYLFFGSGHPARHELQMIFGEVLESIDHWKEALRIYTELSCWEKIVVCYKMLNLRHKAEELIHKKIEEVGETPKLLVLLGDATSDISYYEKAWTLSEAKYADARIRLGDHYFSRRDFEESAECFRDAVNLMPLEYPCWLKLAWSCYKMEDYEGGFQAYLRAANLEYDNFQVWNNLGTCALRLNRKEYALRAYKVAVKCHYDEWKVWNNILIIAVELEAFNDAINAYHRILDLHKDFSEDSILDGLVNIVVNDPKPTATTVSAIAKLLGRITSTASKGPMPWLLYGRVLATYLDCETAQCDDATKFANFDRSMHCYNKALTIMRQNPTWKTDPKNMHNVVQCIKEFRRQRCREIPNDLSQKGFKMFDGMLKDAAMNVFEVIKNSQVDNPNNEELAILFNEMTEELNDAFYA